jgi:hypothetical protein
MRAVCGGGAARRDERPTRIQHEERGAGRQVGREAGQPRLAAAPVEVAGDPRRQIGQPRRRLAALPCRELQELEPRLVPDGERHQADGGEREPADGDQQTCVQASWAHRRPRGDSRCRAR